MNEEFTLQDARLCAKQWVWERMSTGQRIAASRKILDERGVPVGDPRRAGLGYFTWGPANPGGLGDHCEGLLYVWVEARVRARPHGQSGVELINRELLLANLDEAVVLVDSAIAFVAAREVPT